MMIIMMMMMISITTRVFPFFFFSLGTKFHRENSKGFTEKFPCKELYSASRAISVEYIIDASSRIRANRTLSIIRVSLEVGSK